MEMENHPEKRLIDSFLESLVTEKGYSNHTRRAYRKDLLDFLSYLAESRFAGSARPKRSPVVKLKQIDTTVQASYNRKNGHCSLS